MLHQFRTNHKAAGAFEFGLMITGRPDGFYPVHRYSPLTEACSAARLMPRAGQNLSPSRAKQVLTGPDKGLHKN
jgi:hypothetical protein